MSEPNDLAAMSTPDLDIAVPMASLMTWLKEECESQHARAELANSELITLKSALLALRDEMAQDAHYSVSPRKLLEYASRIAAIVEGK